MLSVLQITPTFGESPGGTERYCYFLSKHLAQMGCKVFVAACSESCKRIRCEELVESNFKISVYRFPTLLTLFDQNPFSFLVPHLIKLIKRHQINIIHAHSYIYFSSLQASLIKSILKIPFVLHIHGGIELPLSTFVQRVSKRVYDYTLARLTIKQADAIFCVSNYDARILGKKFGLRKEKLFVVPNAVDIKKFKFTLPNNVRKRILYVGDLEYWKGVHILIQSFKKVSEKIAGSDVELVVAGGGSQLTALMRIVSKHKLPVRFLGVVPHHRIPVLMQNCNLFVLPSLSEGFPTTVLEAMASGLPVIVTSVGGIPEIVRHMKTGILVKPNDVDELAEAMIMLINDKAKSRELAINARSLVEEKYTWEKTAKYVLELYQRILEWRELNESIDTKPSGF